MGFPTLVSNYLLFVGNMEMKESNFQDKSVRQKITTKENKKIIKVNTDKCNYRTERISLCRNQIILEIKKDNKLNKFDHLIILDADNINTLLTPEKIRNTLNMAPQDWLGIFPNQYA